MAVTWSAAVIGCVCDYVCIYMIMCVYGIRMIREK